MPHTRRNLAGAAALILASDRAALATPTASPDAELIRLCVEFDAIEQKHYAAFCASNDDDAREAAMDAMADEHEPLIDRIVELRPTTIEGARALARSLHLWTHGDFADGATTDERLARALVRGLIGEPGSQPEGAS